MANFRQNGQSKNLMAKCTNRAKAKTKIKEKNKHFAVIVCPMTNSNRVALSLSVIRQLDVVKRNRCRLLALAIIRSIYNNL